VPQEKEQARQQDRFQARAVVCRKDEGIALWRKVFEAIEMAKLGATDERYGAQQHAVDHLQVRQRPAQNGPC
jgi:hypothetical protein